MATRRTRIKGIANIPQRRKVENHKPNEDPPVFVEESAPKLENNVQKEVLSNVDVPRRRTFIKPVVNPKLFAQKPKLKLETPIQEEIKTEKGNSAEISTSDVSQNEVLPTIPPLIKHIPPACPVEPIKSPSDSEYPVGPLSPTKLINRSRIKAVPRLGQRRTSMTLHGSASESEDDGRKNFKRIRTESVCSTTSVTNEVVPKSKEFSSVIQRKCKRTEQSRKMAEARRHFLHKFGNQAPDKQKLTMIDLIFYNPTANPMCQKPKKQTVEEADDEEENLENTENLEEIKQPEETGPVESDEENAIPAPQIKIGANGEIVVDEKSLTIENIETKRSREEIQKSKIIDGDFDTGYGIYKREKRSKDWSKEETLRFYKALNTLGPDFSLMVELFAGRSRRELKMKFKKEERVNRLLIDKALTQPVQFDITELRREVEEDQKKTEEVAEKRSLKSTAKKPIPYYGQRKKVSVKEKPRKKDVEQGEPKPQDIYSKLEKGIACVWESDTEEEILTKPCPPVKPTRSGRIPKPRKPYTPKDLTLVKKKRPDSDHELQENTFKDVSALQPGSIMIVSSQTPTGEPTFKVFMVTPTQNKIPITLTPDMLTNLTQSGNENPNTEENIISTEAIEEEMWPYENANISVAAVDVDNITIPENENVTLCSDGKYNIKLSNEGEISPD